jgi:hypothetical protein
MATKTVFITSGTRYTLPSDFGAPWTVEAIGAGGGGNLNYRVGGGGGAYAATSSSDGLFSLNPGQGVFTFHRCWRQWSKRVCHLAEYDS